MRIGLTGGIGSGKSTVAAMLARRGATIVDSDAIAHRLTGVGGTAMPRLRAAFGDHIAKLDGSLDRDAMRGLAFSDPPSKRLLESLLHPLIAAEAEREAAAAQGPIVVFDVPLLAESREWRKRVDRVLVIDCDAQTQVQRVAQRAGWNVQSAERVIASQATRAARRAIADAVIVNHGVDLPGLDHAVDTVWHLWRLFGRDAVEQ